MWFRVLNAEYEILIFKRRKWRSLKKLDIKCNVPILAYLSEILIILIVLILTGKVEMRIFSLY